MNMRTLSRLQRLEKTALERRRATENSGPSIQQVMGALLDSGVLGELLDLELKDATFGTLSAEEQTRSENLLLAAIVDEFGAEMPAE